MQKRPPGSSAREAASINFWPSAGVAARPVWKGGLQTIAS
jgi:hypothetical protein